MVHMWRRSQQPLSTSDGIKPGHEASTVFPSITNSNKEPLYEKQAQKQTLEADKFYRIHATTPVQYYHPHQAAGATVPVIWKCFPTPKDIFASHRNSLYFNYWN